MRAISDRSNANAGEDGPVTSLSFYARHGNKL